MAVPKKQAALDRLKAMRTEEAPGRAGPWHEAGTTLTFLDQPTAAWHPARVPAAPYLPQLRQAVVALRQACEAARAAIPAALGREALTAARAAQDTNTLERIDHPAARRYEQVRAAYWEVYNVVFSLEREGKGPPQLPPHR